MLYVWNVLTFVVLVWLADEIIGRPGTVALLCIVAMVAIIVGTGRSLDRGSRRRIRR
jgi:hypothetical protein